MNSLNIDLHLHTMYSDGKNTLDSVCEYLHEHGLYCISITDHNTIQGNIALQQQERNASLVPGTELRLPGMPDILVYFPNATLFDLYKIEEKLINICQLDQEITLLIANEYFKDNTLRRWKESQFYNIHGNYWLGTLQLSQLLSNSLNPPIEIVKKIRAKKSFILGKDDNNYAIKKLINISCYKWIHDFSLKHNGYPVLAHPYRELIRRFRPKNVLDLLSFDNYLNTIFDECIKYNIKSIEHTTYYSEEWWKQHFSFSTDEANRIFINLVSKNKFNLTIGSDIHDFHRKDKIINSEINKNITQLIPNWLKNI